MDFREYLTKEERLACLKAGMVRKMANYGVTPSQLGFEKGAQLEGIGNFLGKAWDVTKDLGKTGIALSLLGGLPIGAMLHYIDRSATKDSKEVERLTKMRDTYLDVVESVKRKLKNKKERQRIVGL